MCFDRAQKAQLKILICLHFFALALMAGMALLRCACYVLHLLYAAYSAKKQAII
jgi:hypothetical protein